MVNVNITQLINQLKDKHIHLYVEEGKLKSRAASGLITTEIGHQIKENKAEILSWFQHQDLLKKPILPRKIEPETFPLSFSQKRLWTIDKIEGSNEHYNMPCAYQVSGLLDEQKLEATFEALIHNHPMLKTVYSEQEEAQFLAERPAFTLNIVDLSDMPEHQAEKAVHEYRLSDACTPFDLSQDCMLRAAYLKLPNSVSVLVINIHHIAADGWSMEILINEIIERYESGNIQVTNKANKPDYFDYASWQKELYQSGAYGSQLSFWKETLKDAPATHSLPVNLFRTEQGNPPIHANNKQVASVATAPFSAELSHSLRMTAARLNCSLFELMYGLFAITTSASSESNDVLMGTAVAGRNRPELMDLVGFCVNTLVLRLQVSPTDSVEKTLLKAIQVVRNAQDHQDVPFDYIVDEINPVRNASQNPLFQIMFLLDSVGPSNVYIADIPMKLMDPCEQKRKFDLTVSVKDSGADMSVNFEYDSNKFDPRFISEFMERYSLLAQSFVHQLSTPVECFDWFKGTDLTPSVLSHWQDPNEHRPVLEVWKEVVSRFPSRVALQENGHTLTYRELDEKTDLLASHLKRLGAKPESIIPVFLPRGMDVFVSELAILKAGAAFLPIDSKCPTSRLEFILSDCEASIVISNEPIHLAFSGDTVLLNPNFWNQLASDESIILPAEDRSLDSLAYVIYTSGSTGMPKGVLVKDIGLLQVSQWQMLDFDISEQSVTTQMASVAFDASVGEVWAFLLSGACVAIIDEDAKRCPNALLQKMRELSISHSFIPTALMEAIASESDYCDMPDLRYIITAGEALHSVSFPFSDNVQVVNAYGPSENSVVATRYLVQGTETQSPPIGTPVKGVELCVVKGNQLAPVGVLGELFLGGNGVSRGYLNQPEQTKNKFIANPFEQLRSDRLYRTGDLVRMNFEGELEFVRRADDQVQLHGYRIEFGELTHRITASGLVASVAIAIVGEGGQQRLFAFVTAKNDEQNHTDLSRDLLLQLTAWFPSYMVPTVEVVDTLPLTQNGKVDKSFLQERAKSRKLRTDIGLPRTPQESVVIEAFSKVLQVEDISIFDDFFMLGGHSLSVLSLASYLKRQNWVVTAEQIYQNATPSALASIIKPHSSIVVEDTQEVEETFPLLANHHWLLNRYNVNHCNSSALIDFEVSIEGEYLNQSIAQILKHHDGMRRVLISDESGERQQKVQPFSKLAPWWFTEDLSGVDEEALPQALAETCQGYQVSLHIEECLFKAVLFDLGRERGQRLLLVMHRLLIDPYCYMFFMDDLYQGYESARQGKPITLPEKTLSVAEWSRWQYEYAQGKAKDYFPYWKNLSWEKCLPLSEDPNLSLPEEVPEVLAPELLLSQLSVEETTNLNTASTLSGYAHDVILITAMVKTYGAFSGSDAVFLVFMNNGRSISGARHLDLTRTLAWLPNYYNLMFDLTEAQTLQDAVKNVAETLEKLNDVGLSFSALKYMCEDQEVRQTMAEIPRFHFEFGYIPSNSIKGDEPEFGKLMKLAQESQGYLDDVMYKDTPPLIKTYPVGDRLHMHWGYSPTQFTREYVEKMNTTFHHYINEVVSTLLSGHTAEETIQSAKID
ncbi:hypothetical protein CW749_04850 [Vibrio sp. vnigr-6D03]|nr:hypothetical protein CW749_04850 [Vibrio sp. vnigr-6D03]